MKCPKCKSPDLQATKMEQGLPVMGCNKCQGAFVSLLYYRDWAERSGVLDRETSEQTEKISIADIDNTHAAMGCPKCSRIMTKYRISSGQNNRLDLCANCDEVWLDRGEWDLLKYPLILELKCLRYSQKNGSVKYGKKYLKRAVGNVL